MKRILALLLCLTLCSAVLVACSYEESSESEGEILYEEGLESKREILPDIVEAYEIDDEGSDLVNDLFDKFDEAFETLRSKNHDDVTDEDLGNYAKAIRDASDWFDDSFVYYEELLDEKHSSTNDMQEKENLLLIKLDRGSIASDSFNLNSSLFDNNSGESCAEQAFVLVNAYSNFFLGENIITEESLEW